MTALAWDEAHLYIGDESGFISTFPKPSSTSPKKQEPKISKPKSSKPTLSDSEDEMEEDIVKPTKSAFIQDEAEGIKNLSRFFWLFVKTYLILKNTFVKRQFSNFSFKIIVLTLKISIGYFILKII